MVKRLHLLGVAVPLTRVEDVSGGPTGQVLCVWSSVQVSLEGRTLVIQLFTPTTKGSKELSTSSLRPPHEALHYKRSMMSIWLLLQAVDVSCLMIFSDSRSNAWQHAPSGNKPR
ncbi:hypothetical protein EYF80_061752 [Liparis tanakae]|uniref:Uncharacterized protein n=1 Tax=Liparis tanakae TaxID=230148 RepID=A0A4Z2EGT1_9TELE|nr:hypothetical protein EYF80_061752 [Liparis tanakae]